MYTPQKKRAIRTITLIILFWSVIIKANQSVNYLMIEIGSWRDMKKKESPWRAF